MLLAAAAPVASGSPAARNALFVALAIVTVAFVTVLGRALWARSRAGTRVRPTVWLSITGFVANFFDTLGIGSFATTTSIVRHWKLLPDERIPGTMNVAYALPTITEAFIYTRIVPVDTMTLIVMILAAVLGAWLGAGIVSSWPRRRIQIGMGLALLAAATIMVLSQPAIGLVPAGGTLLALGGTRLVLGIVGNFVLGAFMTIGLGLYAPCMILVYMLGMEPAAAFPIMMGSCAFLMPLASVRFVRSGGFQPSAVLGMALAGVPAVLIAAFIVKSLPRTAVTWLVVVVVAYTAVNLLRAARRSRDLAGDAVSAETQPA